jgi:cardiolipin synthase (CMP-forming)
MSSNLNVPNVLSSIRILLVFPLAYYLWNQENTIAAIIGASTAVTDIADGYIARKYNLITNLGKILDPLADKLIAGVALAILLWQGRIPEWYVALVLGKDVILMLGGLYAARKLKFVIPANKFGKYAALFTGFTVLFAILDLTLIRDILIVVSSILVVISFVGYIRGGIKQMKESKE